jgi:hypothetical protein
MPANAFGLKENMQFFAQMCENNEPQRVILNDFAYCGCTILLTTKEGRISRFCSRDAP